MGYKTIADSSITRTIVFGVSMIHVKTARYDRRWNYHTIYKTIADSSITGTIVFSGEVDDPCALHSAAEFLHRIKDDR